jgi:hypothetical protein
MEILLCLKRGAERLRGGAECHAECIPDDMENITLPGSHGGMQDGMMPLAQPFPFLGMFLGKFGTAFDICEKECDGSGGQV